MTVHIAIAHSAWVPEREATLARLLGDLRAFDVGEAQEELTTTDGSRVAVFTSRRREHASVWARRLWEYAEAQPEDTVTACLNDDVRVCPHFPQVVQAMADAVPDEVLCLHMNNPASVELSKAGHRFARMYMLSGPGYLLRPHQARDLLDWTGKQGPALFASTNEDNVAIHWAWSRQRPFWCSIPAIVQHDTGVPSTCGFDHHPHRQAYVTWEGYGALTSPAFWRTTEPPPYVQGWMSEGEMVYVRRMLRNGSLRTVNGDMSAECWFCRAEGAAIMASVTGCKIGPECMRKIAASLR